ncbi:MAG: SulP family inorganic anion transporter [Caldilineaceae bacterium]
MTNTTLKRPKTERTLKSFFTVLDWLPKYKTDWLRLDVIAAITVWALLVPEAMAYAGIAGMPPETGLYTAPLALLGYALFGTSRHLNVGPSSTVAIISFGVIGLLAPENTIEFYAMTSALAIVTGVAMVAGGLLRLGVFADFLSKPVLDGFIVGLAITIAVGQLDKLLGYSVESPAFIPDTLALLANINQLQIVTFGFGIASLAGLFAMERYVPKIPAAITIVVIAILVTWLLNAVPFLPDVEQLGLQIVGNIPAGRIPFGLPSGLSLLNIINLIPGAIAVAIVGFSESVAAARSYAAQFGYEIDADQEMVGLGIANVGAGLSGGFVVDGSLSKTAASVQAGAKSQMVSVLAAVMILVTAWFLTGFFYYLPEATLGAIVIHAVWHLINYRSIMKYRKYTRVDYYTALIATLGVLIFGILAGLLLAVGIALLALLAAAKNRTTSVLGKVADENGAAYRSLTYFPDAQTVPGLLILRFDGTLFFANAPEFSVETIEGVDTAEPHPRVVLMDAEEITDIDATAIIGMSGLNATLATKGVDLWFANVRSDVREVMQRSGFEDLIGADRFYLSIEAGVAAFQSEPQAAGASTAVAEHGESTGHLSTE